MATLPFFSTPCVRDLAWSCFGEDLIHDFTALKGDNTVKPCHLHLTPDRLDWLQWLDNNPASLLEHLSQLRSTRLGLYFEALWQFFISQDAELALIAHNLQVSKNKKTYGEFDLIYHDSITENYYHLELAIKFYLNNSVSTDSASFSADFQHWLGPNAIDRLDLKTDHLLNHQIQLSRSDVGRQALQSLGIVQVTSEVALKGRLFYPYPVLPTPDVRPLSATHNIGQWLTIDQLSIILHNDELWVVLDRKEWISPVHGNVAKQKQRLYTPEKLKVYLGDYFAEFSQPIMIASTAVSEKNVEEKKRYFITATSWPPKN